VSQVDTAISKEVTHRSLDLVDAAGQIGGLHRVLRQLHFRGELAQRRLTAQREASGQASAALSRLKQRRENLARLQEVRGLDMTEPSHEASNWSSSI
jgi:hypothetical protein